jgi:hypothetical protein
MGYAKKKVGLLYCYYYSHSGKFLKENVVSIPKVNVTILEEFKKLS